MKHKKKDDFANIQAKICYICKVMVYNLDETDKNDRLN